MVVSESVKRLFEEYEKAFSSLDIVRSAGFFADTFISADPNGTIPNNKTELLKSARHLACSKFIAA